MHSLSHSNSELVSSGSFPFSPNKSYSGKLSQPGTPDQSGTSRVSSASLLGYIPRINLIPTVTNLSADIEAKATLKYKCVQLQTDPEI